MIDLSDITVNNLKTTKKFNCFFQNTNRNTHLSQSVDSKSSPLWKSHNHESKYFSPHLTHRRRMSYQDFLKACSDQPSSPYKLKRKVKPFMIVSFDNQIQPIHKRRGQTTGKKTELRVRQRNLNINPETSYQSHTID